MNVMLAAVALFASSITSAQDVSALVESPEVVQPNTVEQVESVQQPIFEEPMETSQEVKELVEVAKTVDEKVYKEALAEIDFLEEELSMQDAMVEKLSMHLESALKRLNARSGVEQTPAKISAVMAAKDKAQRKVIQLEEEHARLKREMDALTKEKQLLDMENRQLFHAINGAAPVKKFSTDRSLYSKDSRRHLDEDMVSYR